MKDIISLIAFIILLSSCNPNEKDKLFITKKIDSLNELSHHYLNINNFDSAQYFINQILFLDSTNYVGYNDRGCLKFKKHLPPQEAIADFERSLKINPGYENALFNLAVLYNEIKDHQKAFKACNRYDFQRNLIDSEHVKIIEGIRLRSQDYEKLINGISTSRAIAFSDSLHSILSEGDMILEKFENKFGVTQRNVLQNRNSFIDFDGLDRLLDSVKLINEIQIKEISIITEIDSSLNYKKIILNFLLDLGDTYNTNLTRYFYCLKTKDPVLIKNCWSSVVTVLKKRAELVRNIKILQRQFEIKYGFTTSDK